MLQTATCAINFGDESCYFEEEEVWNNLTFLNPKYFVESILVFFKILLTLRKSGKN